MSNKYLLKESIKEIGIFSVPVLIEQVSAAAMSIAATLLIANIGEAAVAGLTLIDSLVILICQLFLAVEIGTIVIVAQFCGRGEYEFASRTICQSLLTAVSVSVVIAALNFAFPKFVLGFVLNGASESVVSYASIYFRLVVLSFPALAVYTITSAALRGSGFPRLSLIGVVVTNIVFIGLGCLLIFVFKMGIEGVGISMISARVAGAIVSTVLLAKMQTNLVLRWAFLKNFHMALQKSIFQIATPAFFENIIFLSGRLLTISFSVPFGTAAMAANSYSNMIAMIYNIPGNTASVVAIPIVGKYLGMKDKRNAWVSSILILCIGTLSMGALGLVIALFIVPISNALSSEPDISKVIIQVSIANFIISPFAWVTSFVLPAILRASGDTKYTSVVSIFSILAIRVTFAYIFAVLLDMGVLGIWFGMFADWIVRSILFGIRYIKRGWLDRELLDGIT